MRLWSVHPKHLDSKGLVACWREALLAQAVLSGETKGYKNHPQLNRFKIPNWNLYFANYLWGLYDEALARNYNFAVNKIRNERSELTLTVNDKQLDYEFRLLNIKRIQRGHESLPIDGLTCHPMFIVIEGPIADWEKRKRFFV